MLVSTLAERGGGEQKEFFTLYMCHMRLRITTEVGHVGGRYTLTS